MFLHWSLVTQNHKQNNLQNALSKSSPTMCTAAAMIIFWGFYDFLIYLAKYFWSLLDSPYLDLQLFFSKNNVNKTF